MLLDVTTPAEQTDESGDEEDDVSEEDQIEEQDDGKDDDDDDDEENDISEEDQEEGEQEQEQDDDEEESATRMPLAMMAGLVGPSSKTLPEEGLSATDSEDSFADDTGSEPETDEGWRQEQIYLNTILNARNEFTLMPSTWRMHFRGIPLPDSLFYFKSKSKSVRPRIYARTDKLEYRGAVALRKLIDVHARIQDIRNDENAIKHDNTLSPNEKNELIKVTAADMAKQLRRALEQALDWAKKDGGIINYEDQLPPNVRIIDIKLAPDQPESELKIQIEMCELAKHWRSYGTNADEPSQAPVIFGFVIMKHIITIVTMDASDPNAIIHVPCQLHMAERNQHQWNALAILVTVCWARDVLLEYINTRPDLQPEVKIESSDPDA
ncbi:hypothetical protein HD806DRAFT_518906 [Xylariaceae sp. AK1471]|nr:hypothetical protein HD806DRAFT_518906 [Xylariaceae sp. AK1471]